jgi:hypothetical protein
LRSATRIGAVALLAALILGPVCLAACSAGSWLLASFVFPLVAAGGAAAAPRFAPGRGLAIRMPARVGAGVAGLLIYVAAYVVVAASTGCHI